MRAFPASRMRTFLASIMVTGCFALSPTSAQEMPKTLASRFPADGLIAYFEFEGLAAQPKAWQGSHMYGLMNKTSMGELARDLARQGLKAMIDQADEEAPGDGKTDPKVIESLADNLAKGGIAIGLYQPPGRGEPVPIMLGRGAGKGLDHKLLEGYMPPTDRTETRGGRTIRLRGDGRVPGPAIWWEKDDIVIVDSSILDLAIAAADGKGATAATHPILSGIKGGSAAFVPMARAFADFSKIPLPPEARTLGMDGIRHVEMTGGFEGSQIRNIVRVVAPSPRRGVVSLLDGPTFAADTMPPIHPGASGFAALSMEPAAVFTKVASMARTMDPQLGRQIDGFLGQFRQQTDVDIVNDLLKGMGPGMSFGTIAARGRNGGDNFATVQVSDAAAFGRTVDKLAPVLTAIADQAIKAQAGPNAGGFEIRRTEAGRPEWIVQLPDLAPGLAELSPRFRIEKNTLAFAFDPRTIDMLQQTAARGTPYAFKGDYAPLAQRLPKTMAFLQVQDLKTNFPALVATVPQLLQSIGPAVAAARNQEFPFRIDPNLIPTAEAMAPYLAPSAMTVSVHPEGIKIDSTASVPSMDQPTVTAVVVALLLPAVQSAREAARRAQCVNNHKQIAIAMHNYADANGGFPAMAITGKNGEPLLSWRVALLPYLEQQELYEAFRKDEPWDSPHNKPLLARMPAVFTCPSNPLTPGMTCYRAFVGDGALLEKDKPTRLESITDGTENTLMFAESVEPVEWTRPEGLSAKGPGKLPLGSKHPGGFDAAFSDGSIRFIKSETPQEALKAVITKAGGEVIDPLIGPRPLR